MIEVLVLGAVTSAVYTLLAIGFTMIFSVARVINLAHGAFYALAAYIVFFLTAYLALPVAVAIVAAVALTSLFGVAMERVLIRPLRASHMAVLLVTLAVSLFLEQSLAGLFTSQSRNIPSLVEGTVLIGGVAVAAQRVLTFAAAVMLVCGLMLFIHRTRLGAAILAISEDPIAAVYVGIPANRVFSIVMAISAAMAACASVLASPFLSVSPGMGLVPMVKAFTIVILGGLGSITGSIIAACLLGYLETIVAFKVSPAWAEVSSVIVVFLTLTLRPSGLLGRQEA